MRKQPMTVRAARWSAAHPGKAIAGWLVFVVVCFALGLAIGSHEATDRDYRVGEAGQAKTIAESGGLTPPAVERVLITPKPGPPPVLASARTVAADVAGRMGQLPEVSHVAEPVASADGQAVMVAVTMAGDAEEAKKKVDPLLEVTSQVQEQHPDFHVAETGNPSQGKGLNAQRSDDLALAEMITLPVTLLVLLLVFGSVLTAGVPVLLMLTAIFGSMGLYALSSSIFPDAGVGNQIILMMGMAVGVDYSLFYLKREREERERAGGALSSAAAVELAAATSGRAIVMSGLAVIVSSACLFFADDVIFDSLAAGTITVVFVAMVSSLTVLPAVLVTLGKRVDKQLPFLRRKNGERGKLWATLLRPAIEKPGRTLAISTLALLVLAVPMLGMRLGVPGNDTYSRSIPTLRVQDELAAAFPAERSKNLIAVRDDAARPGQLQAALERVVTSTEGDPLFAGNTGVGGVAPPLNVSADGTVGTLELGVPHDISTDEASRALQRLRTHVVPPAMDGLTSPEFAIGGDVAENSSYVEHQNAQLPWVLACVLLASVVTTGIAFRSVLIALIGTALTALSAAAAVGIMVLVFQGTWAENLLGFDSTGFVGSRVPLFLIVILFGLSMDYQIFVVSRIREAVLRGVPNRTAIHDGISGSASVVTSAAVVMVTVFVSYMFLHLLEMKQIGFSLAVGVLIDAAIVRIVVLPSIMVLLGRWSWWPAKAFRAVPRDQPLRDQPLGEQPAEEMTTRIR